MALVENNNNIKYDTTGRFYYLTTVGAKALTGYDLKWKNIDSRLKKQGRALKRYLTLNAYNTTYLEQHRPIDLFEYMVFKNENNEVNDIIEMLVEMVEWAYDTDGDRAIYEDGGGARVPETVKDIAHSTNLRIVGRVDIYIETVDYRVGY